MENNWTPGTIKAWTAGIIDGEGTVSIIKHKRAEFEKHVFPGLQMRLRVANTNKDMLSLLQLSWGGNIYAPKRRREGHKQAYFWDIGCSRAVRVLESILPYLITKHNHAQLGIIYQDRVNKKIGRNGKYLSSREKEMRLSMYEQMKVLNRKGSQDAR